MNNEMQTILSKGASMKILRTLCSSLMALVLVFLVADALRSQARGTPHASAVSATQFHTVVAPVTVQPQVIEAVYSVAEVDIGDSAMSARLIQYAAVQRIFAPDRAEYSPPIDLALVNKHASTNARAAPLGFKGLGSNHFARADV